jgi:transposase
VTAEVQDWIREQIRRQPDVTLMELQSRLEKTKGCRLSIGRLWLALRDLGLRLKKSHSTPRSKTRRKLTGRLSPRTEERSFLNDGRETGGKSSSSPQAV